VLLFTSLPETRPPEERVGSSFGSALQAYGLAAAGPHFLGLTLIGGFGMASFFAYLANSSFVLIDHYGLTPRQYSVAFAPMRSFIGVSQLTSRLGSASAWRRWCAGARCVGYAAVMVLALGCMLAGSISLAVMLALLFVGYGFLGLVVPRHGAVDGGARRDRRNRVGAGGTLHFAMLLLFAVTFFCIWLIERQRRQFLLFALSFLTFAVATFMQFALWPSDIGYNTIITSALYSAGPLLLVEGVLARSGRSMPRSEYAAWFTAIVGTLLYFYYVENDLQVRVYVLNLGMAFIFLSGVWKIRQLMRGGVLDRAVFWLLLGLAATFIVRTLLTGSSVPKDNIPEFFQSDFWIWAQLTMSVLGVAMGLGLLVVASADVILALKAERDSDPLTGLLNRRGLQGKAPRLLALGRRRPLSIVACDIDRFKAINDRFGHAAGDVVLSTIAGIIRSKLRAGDIAARTGGEEFVIVMKDASVDDAFSLTERLRREIANVRFANMPEDFAVTCSFGIAQFHAGEGLWDAIGRADKVLYAAKRAGRNRTFAEGLQLPSAA
jgi:diguanylate cyclase (GGDEF)-like protein